MKLSKWAKIKGLSYQTAYRMAKSGKINGVEIFPTGTIIVNEIIDEDIKDSKRIVVYARVSSHSRKSEMCYQVNRIVEFANSNGYKVDSIYKEVASGMNDNRTQFWKMINSNPTTIIIENKDRLTRFGYNYIEKLGSKLGINIILMNPLINDQEDLMKDLVSVITSFCCRLYGLRRGHNKASKIKYDIKDDNH